LAFAKSGGPTTAFPLPLLLLVAANDDDVDGEAMGNADIGWAENADATLGTSRDVEDDPPNAEVEAGWDAKAEDAALARLENVLLESGLLCVLNADTGWDWVWVPNAVPPKADTGC
jgi:hypothetical protein